MLINIILLILFFIILFWKSNVVEGQSDVPVFNILPGFFKDELILYEKEKKDDRPKETILDTFPHFERDYIYSAEIAGFTLLNKNDWYDNDDDIPRLISFLFQKPL